MYVLLLYNDIQYTYIAIFGSMTSMLSTKYGNVGWSWLICQPQQKCSWEYRIPATVFFCTLLLMMLWKLSSIICITVHILHYAPVIFLEKI